MQREDSYNVQERTFGLELEFADVDKSGVILPEGFSWSKDETFVNTDMSLVSGAGNRGGEVNTPPLRLNEEDLGKLKFVLDQLLENGGRLTWVCSIHVHIGIADLGLDELKRLFALSYFSGRYIYEYSDLEDWNEETWYLPIPDYSYYEAAMKTETKEAFFNVFANSMRKGYIRHVVNVASYFKRGTIEFRNFNATTKWEELCNCIDFAYKYVEYALNHSIEEMKTIGSYDEFLAELEITGPAPKHTAPCIFVGNMKVYAECMRGKDVPLTSKLMSVLIDNMEGDKLAIVNPNLYSAELNLYKRYNLVVYNNDEMNHIIYRICKEGLVIHYGERYKFIEQYNDETPVMQLVCLFLYHRLRKFIADNEFARKQLDAYKDKLSYTIDKMKATCEEIIAMFGNCVYKHGTVNDAISENDVIFYQLGNSSKARSTAATLKKDSDYADRFEKLSVDYYHLVEDLPKEKTFMMASTNAYLPMNKIAENNNVFFYSTKEAKDTKFANALKDSETYDFIVPEDDLEITDYTKLRIVMVKPTAFFQLQRAYIKKVHKISMPEVTLLVYYDKYCLGGFGFNKSKDEDEFDLWLLSDFNTNNNVFRLSKLVLLCIQSEQVKKILQRKQKITLRNLYTKIYTQNPVSMKYRGVFKKDKERSKVGCLIYTSELGISGSLKDIMTKYNNMKQ